MYLWSRVVRFRGNANVFGESTFEIPYNIIMWIIFEIGLYIYYFKKFSFSIFILSIHFCMLFI